MTPVMPGLRKSALIGGTVFCFLLSLPSRASIIEFLDPLGLVTDKIMITQLGAPGSLDLTIDVFFMLNDVEVSLQLDPGGQDTYTYTGFVDEFWIHEMGDGWLSNFDLGPDSTLGTKTYDVLDNYSAYGSCSFLDKCTWDIYVTSVPLPAAVWLFGSALVGLGLHGRRRAAKQRS